MRRTFCLNGHLSDLGWFSEMIKPCHADEPMARCCSSRVHCWELLLTQIWDRPNKPKNGGITAGISRAGAGRETGASHGAESGTEVSQPVCPSTVALSQFAHTAFPLFPFDSPPSFPVSLALLLSVCPSSHTLRARSSAARPRF